MRGSPIFFLGMSVVNELRTLLRVMLILVGMILLTSCEPLSEEQCANSNWYSVGVRDGELGRSNNFIEQYRQSCSEFGIAPQESLWTEGLIAGRNTYCNADRGYSIGRDGERLPNVCSASQRRDMTPAYNWGREYFRLTREINELRSLVREREAQMEGMLQANPIYDMNLLFIARSNEQILQLENRRSRYSSWRG